MTAAIEPNQFLIIIGSAKSGTTSLFNYLGQHPSICPSVPKEPEYFTQHRERRRNVLRYEELWTDFDARVHRYALEASVGYTMWPKEQGVAQRMRAYGLRPRLVYIVRDPIERIESHVNFRRVISRQKVSFEDQSIIDVSRYAKQLEPYVDTFGYGSVRVIDFARLCAEPNEVCSDLYDWLGLEQRALSDIAISNETVHLKRSQLERWDVLKKLARKLPPAVHQPARKIALEVLPYQHHRERLTPVRAQEIRDSLRQDVATLARDWDIDVSSWGFDHIP